MEDRLPETTDFYLVYPPMDADKQMGWAHGAPRYFMANEHRNTFVGKKLAYGWVKSTEHKITHWRPLPAPPSEANGPDSKGKQC